MNVCEVLIDILGEYGIKHIFGIPGDAINELIEAIRKQEKIKFIHVMHEETGAFAASAQAKLSGELSVCAGTAGPGAIHLLNGLYDAKMDSAPVLAITGQVDTSMVGTFYQQEVNLQSLFNDVTVYNQTIMSPDRIPEIIDLAIKAAVTERGVAHISIPSNISVMKVPGYQKRKKWSLYNSYKVQPCETDLQKAAEFINGSVKPCILAGIGARNAATEVLELAEVIKAPVVKALRGKDIIPDVHPYVLGGIGLLGTKPSVEATKNCDLFIVIGSDFPYYDFYPVHEIPMIQIDRDPRHIGRRHPVSVGLVGEAKLTIELLLPLLTIKTDDSFLREAQKNKEEWLGNQTEKESDNNTDKFIHPQALAKCISDLSDDNAIICCDTGAVTVWGARHFYIKGQQRFTLSGGLASMAFALPAAIGAKLLFHDRQVIALCGDGGFAMLMCDFATAIKYGLNIKVFVFNNSKLGLIQMEQEGRSGNPEFETSLHNPDYAIFAGSCGGDGYTVKDASDLDLTIRKALKSSKACVINVHVNPGEITWPPEIHTSEAVNYIKAKITEYFN